MVLNMYKHIHVSYELKFDTTNPTNYTCYTLTSPIDETENDAITSQFKF